MILWFAGLSFLLVAWIFASPAIDYRLVVVAAVVPSVELIGSGPWPLHTLLAPVLAMTLIMVGLRGRRLLQRRWLGVPIGLFMHLVLDGSWARTTLYWWPVFGWRIDADDAPSLPSTPVLVLMELGGLVACLWAIRRYRLDRPDERALFLHQGRLSRQAMADPTAG